jgi:DNA mismatch repair ATPase MutS
MHPDLDFNLDGDLPPNTGILSQDLELDTLLQAMASGDKFIYEMAQRAVLLSATEPATILYRQRILADCLAQPATARELYDLAVASVEGERTAYFGWTLRDSPDTILARAVAVLGFFTDQLKLLRTFAEEHMDGFDSEGFGQLFRMLVKELSDDYFSEVEGHLKELRFRGGTLISAQLGKGNKGIRYVLRRRREQSWRERLSRGRSGYSFQIADRDDSGHQALSELHGKGVNLVANALAQSTDHILSFFRMLRSELAFYIGCLNLHGRLTGKNEPTCFPVPLAGNQPELTAVGLYDPCLTLHIEPQTVGNDLAAGGKAVVMITGANQGGKSTFLRSVGLAQLMTQCGMFAPAQILRISVCNGVFTHCKREEDAAMDSGKLDEELARMSDIVDQVSPGCVVLCNESFASTNEREGAQIAREVVRAFVNRGIRVFFVTHLFDLAHRLHAEARPDALFLRAERRPGGERTFRIVQGEPQPTSYGADLYRDIFGAVLGGPASR